MKTRLASTHTHTSPRHCHCPQQLKTRSLHVCVCGERRRWWRHGGVRAQWQERLSNETGAHPSMDTVTRSRSLSLERAPPPPTPLSHFASLRQRRRHLRKQRRWQGRLVSPYLLFAGFARVMLSWMSRRCMDSFPHNRCMNLLPLPLYVYVSAHAHARAARTATHQP